MHTVFIFNGHLFIIRGGIQTSLNPSPNILMPFFLLWILSTLDSLLVDPSSYPGRSLLPILVGLWVEPSPYPPILDMSFLF